MQPTASYTEPNEWYRNMFAANIKTEPGTNSDSNYQTQQNSPESTSNSVTTHLENYLKQQQQQFSNMDTSSVIDMPADQQQQFLRTAEMHQQLMQQHQYQQHFQQAQKAAAHNQIMSHLPTGFNPLTPPGLPHAIIPAMSHFYNQCTQQQQQRMSQQTPSPKSLLESVEKTSLTPRLTPPMDITPPKSPKVSNDSISETEPDLKPNFQNERKVKIHDTEADEDDDGDEIDNIHLPTFNSHGKIKNHKCKTCGKTLHTKLAFWEHCKIHMKPEKILQCAKCPFVTELKHHLEYHIRKHKNLKPFKCDKCSYSCVNKSMLNSHRKSHSSVYQYRCADCDYATKYCHSFKLHLRKYNHKPGMVLDEDGLPNPSIIIDVYGTRRGPKNKAASVAKMRKTNDGLKLPIATQMSVAALENMCLERQKQMSVSPAPSNSSEISESLGSTPSMTLQQHEEPSSILQPQSLPLGNENNAALNILPPMMPLAQLKSGISFYSLWEMLAAQLSPRIREHIQNNFLDKTFENQLANESANCTEENTDGGQEYPEFGRKSVDSAMDLSQGTPNKEEQQQITPDFGMNLQTDIETPVNATSCSSSAAKRKGRVLKLDQEKEKLKDTQNDSATTTPQHDCTTEMPLAPAELINKIEDHVLPNDTTETRQNSPDDPTHNQTHASNPTSTNTASSSGNSSNSSSANFNSANTTANSSPATTPTMYECKYCDIFFKDAVLYTIHMGYHSCDDAFKCNMCGEKCEGPVGLFVHMARNAHS